jgi:hypothetical protein
MSTPSQPRRAPLGLFPDRPGPRLYDRTIEVLRVRHYSRRTEEAYVYWIRRYLEFHAPEHPRRLREEAANRFLTHLAVKEHVAASTQNQALAAILFLYQHVLEQPLNRIEGVIRAKRPRRLPVVLTPDEVTRVIAHLRGDKWLVTMLLYGGGLRLMEALRLRVKDLDFERGEITVREGKGDKDRRTILPASLHDPPATCKAFKSNIPETFGTALSWPLSGPNFSFAINSGSWWGFLGAFPVVVVTLAFGRTFPLAAAVVGASLWAAVTGVCFFVWVASVASC